jgi:hypothetical protein
MIDKEDIHKEKKMSTYIAMIRFNKDVENSQVNQILEQLKEQLKLQPTTQDDNLLKILKFEGNIETYYNRKMLLESEKLAQFFELIDIGKASQYQLEALEESQESQGTSVEERISDKSDKVKEWISNQVSELGQLFGWNRYNYLPQPGALGGNQKKSGQCFLSLTIAGQDYELRLLSDPNEDNIYLVKLDSQILTGGIPGGFKLTLINSEGEVFEDEALTARDYLEVKIKGEPGEEYIWETTPLPEDYAPLPLQF